MPRVIATHGVANMETWLAGGAERAEIFRQFSSAYRVYRHSKDSKVAIVWEKAKARHTVREPIEMYVEVKDGR